MRQEFRKSAVETLPKGNKLLLAEAVSKLVMALPEEYLSKLLVDLAAVATHKKMSMQDALLQIVSNAASNIGKPIYSFLN